MNENMLINETHFFDSIDLLSSSATITVGFTGGGGGGGAEDAGIGSVLDIRRICLSTILDSIGLVSFFDSLSSVIVVAISPPAIDE